VLLFMGRWVFLLPLLVLLPAALVLRRAALLPLAAAALVTLGPVMGLRTGWRQLLPAPDGPGFRVVSYNVGGDHRGGRSLGFLLPVMLEEWRPDVLALQECGNAVRVAAAGLEGWHRHDEAGLCLLSRHPIREAAVMDRRAIERLGRGTGAGGSGQVARYVLDTPHGPVHLTNVHLATPREGLEGLVAADPIDADDLWRLRLNTEVRALESELARRWVDAGGAPRIVAGDFNTPVESRIFQTRWGDLTDAFSHVGRGFGMTKHNGWIRARIDHVLAGPRVRVRAARLGQDLGSDHIPLVVDLVLARD
jgi:endonuclease/exonuclease/phosphatase (EEP) superfamily protein YafD